MDADASCCPTSLTSVGPVTIAASTNQPQMWWPTHPNIWSVTSLRVTWHLWWPHLWAAVSQEVCWVLPGRTWPQLRWLNSSPHTISLSWRLAWLVLVAVAVRQKRTQEHARPLEAKTPNWHTIPSASQRKPYSQPWAKDTETDTLPLKWRRCKALLTQVTGMGETMDTSVHQCNAVFMIETLIMTLQMGVRPRNLDGSAKLQLNHSTNSMVRSLETEGRSEREKIQKLTQWYTLWWQSQKRDYKAWLPPPVGMNHWDVVYYHWDGFFCNLTSTESSWLSTTSDLQQSSSDILTIILRFTLNLLKHISFKKNEPT